LRREQARAEARAGIDDAGCRSTPSEPAARGEINRPVEGDEDLAETTPSVEARHGASRRLLRAIGKRLSTLAIALVAILISLVTWQHYVTGPWTRNGSVRVQVANVAPQISGKIVELRVADNAFVHKGDVLYVIDPFDFDVAVRVGKDLVDQRAADLEIKQAESMRRQHLSNLATTPEEQQIFAGNAAQAKAAFAAAAHQLAQAELNLKRTNVVSPVNGYVTNLLLRVGDYAVTGASNISVIDSDSFWVDGYFEETKMAGVCVGDHAEAQLMGYARPILGHVKTVTRGVSVSNAAAGTHFQLPIISTPTMAPSAMSVRRDSPRHMTVLPGGGSLARAR
jgi:multidrug resistance efflux pump